MDTLGARPLAGEKRERPENCVSMNALKPSLPEAARVLHNDGTLIIATWESYFLSVWRTPVAPVGVAIWNRLLMEMHKQQPGKRLHSLAYLEPTSMFDTSDATFHAIVESLKRVESFCAAMVTIYNREGFWNATMRGKLTAMFNESNSAVPYAVHPTLHEAIVWLAERGAKESHVDQHGLAQQVESLRKL